MDNRIPAPNYTQVPNVIFDYWMHKLDSSSFKVLLFICRKTFGWHKIKDSISLKQIQEGTHLAKQTVIKSLKILEFHRLIQKESNKSKLGDQDPNTYELIINERVVQNLDGGSLNFRLGVVQNLDTQNKDIQKEIEKEAFGQFVKFSKDEYQTLCNRHGQQIVDAIIESINDHCVNNRPSGYNDYAAAFRVFLNNHKPSVKSAVAKPQNAIEANKKLAQQIEKCYKSKNYRIDVLSKGIEFTPLYGQKLPDQILYSTTESSFKEQIESMLGKRDFKKIGLLAA